MKQQRLTKRKIREARVMNERGAIKALKKKGLKGGREWYRFLRNESVSGTDKVECLKVNGRIIENVEEIKECIKEYWEEIGGVGEVSGVSEVGITLERMDAEEIDERISREEVEACLKRQKNNKAAGLDEIPYEMYKNGGMIVLEKMTELFNEVWESERVPV